jgi:hypothetical protein
MAERICAATPDQALSSYEALKRCKPIRFFGIKWMVRLDGDTFLLRCTKPRVLKEGQELYKIESQ